MRKTASVSTTTPASALRACRGIADAVVISSASTSDDLRLVGYVACERPDDLGVEEVLGDLRLRLPPHLVPDALVALRAFPLTPNGKLDRAALPAPASRAARAGAPVGPVTELQERLVRLWEVLLDVHPIGIRDNFFALGGHSLLAVRLVGEIERWFHLRLPLTVLFERPTIEALADALRSDPADLDVHPLVKLNASGTATPFFYLHASFGGGGYYCLTLAEQLGPDQPLFALGPHGLDGRPIPARCKRASGVM